MFVNIGAFVLVLVVVIGSELVHIVHVADVVLPAEILEHALVALLERLAVIVQAQLVRLVHERIPVEQRVAVQTEVVLGDPAIGRLVMVHGLALVELRRRLRLRGGRDERRQTKVVVRLRVVRTVRDGARCRRRCVAIAHTRRRHGR